MSATKPAIKMPELLLFAKSLTIGFVVTAVGRAAFYIGSPLAPKFSDAPVSTQIGGVLFVAIICITYLIMRNAIPIGLRMVCSLRIDLLIFFIIGIHINYSISFSSWPDFSQHILGNVRLPNWELTVFLVLFAVLFSPIIQNLVLMISRIATKLWQHIALMISPRIKNSWQRLALLISSLVKRSWQNAVKGHPPQ